MPGFRDGVAIADARHLRSRGSHTEVDEEDKMVRGFAGEEGAMRFVMLGMFARSNEK